MFTIDSPDFPATASANGIQGVAIAPNVGGIGAAAFQAVQNPAIEAVEVVTVPPYSDVIVVAIPPTLGGNSVEDIGKVQIGRSVYVLADEVDPEASSVSFFDAETGETLPIGTYAYNPTTQELRIYPHPEAPPLAGETITYTAIQEADQVFTDKYVGDIPRFFKKWNVFGDLSFEQSLGQSPSGSLQFMIDRDEFDLCDWGEDITFEWCGNAYAVSGVSLQYNPLDADNMATVSVSLTGPWDHLMDDQVRYRGHIIDAHSVKTTSTEADDGDLVDISLASLCNRAGFDYIGPSVTIKIDPQRDRRDSTTIGSELGRARSKEAFAYLSNPKGLEFRKWFEGRTVHRLSKSDILNGADGDSETPISITYNTTGNKWGCTSLAKEYRNTQLNVDPSEGDRGSNNQKNVYETKLGGSAYIRTTNGGIVLYTPPSGVDRSVPTANFDMGGPTKDFTREKIINGTTVSRERTVYGYAYKCSDFATWKSAGDAKRQSFDPPELQPRTQGWGQVAHELEEYEFDGDGYLIRIVKTITTKRRFKQETEQRESLKTNALATFATSTDGVRQAALRASYTATLTLYDYFDCTETDVTEFTLASMEGLYPEMPPLEDGKPDRKYVSRMSRSLRHTYQNRDLSAIAIDDAGNATSGAQTVTPFSEFSVDLKGLTVATGIDYEESLERDVIYPWRGITKEKYDETKDHYQECTHQRKASGEALKNVDAPADVTTDYYGKVSIAQRLEIFEEDNSPQPDEDDEDDKKLLMNTPNSGVSSSSGAIDGSVTFPSAYTESAARKAANCDISIANTKACEVWSGIMVPANRLYEVGDRVRYGGNMYRVLSVSDRPTIAGGEIRRGVLELSWGREIDLRGEVSISKVD